MDQIDCLVSDDICFFNGPCDYDNFPSKCHFLSEAIKLANYNNAYKGVIDKSFFIWALKEGISYEAIRWFVVRFSKQNNREIKYLIKALFKKYRLYLDESNNIVKFRFKSVEGETNAAWFDDFVLAGVVLAENSNFSIDELFADFRFQKTVVDAKLKHIAKYNGEKSDRLIQILQSDKVLILLSRLYDAKGTYMLWSTQSLWYYALADLVDSCLEIPFYGEAVKNVLYNRAMKDGSFFQILGKYGYPCISKEKTIDFCSEVIEWIDSINADNGEEAFFLECLRQGIKTSRKADDLLFLNYNNEELIESFAPLYASKVGTFPNSTLIYDNCGIIESKIGRYVEVSRNYKNAEYSFSSSTGNKWIQLADMVAGINGALMAYINTHDIKQIKRDFESFSDIQKRNIELLLKLRKKSSKENIFFDHMSPNYLQMERLIYMMVALGIK